MEPLVPLVTLGIVVLSVFAGVVLPSFGKAALAAAMMAVAWIIVAAFFDLLPEFNLGYSLGMVFGFTAFAVIAHALRRMIGAGWRRLRKQ